VGTYVAGISDLRPPYEITETNPSFYLLYYMLKGKSRLVMQGKEFTIRPGHLLITPPKIPHCYYIDSPQMRIVWFHLADIDRWKNFDQAGPIIRESPLAIPMEKAMDGLLTEISRDEADSERAGRMFSEILTIYLMRELQADDDPAAHRVRHQLYELWDEVDANLQNQWTVADMAAHIHITPTHFHRLVRKYSNASPMEVVTRLRMQRAEYLLRRTDYPLKWIAELVGYTNAFALSVAFKRYAGDSPREYRRRKKQ
jgi:AraC family transcriptional regulator, arabinose operon regulatory protein